MSSFGHEGALTSAPAELTSHQAQQQTNTQTSRQSSDVVLPLSAPAVPTQPKGEDSASAFPTAAADVCSSSSGTLHRSVSNLSCFRDDSSSAPPESPFSAGADAASERHAPESRNMGVSGKILPAAASDAAAKPQSKFLQVARRVLLPSRDRISTRRDQLLLNCLLGDPFICLSVDRRVGVSAGTLLGRLALYYWGESAADAEERPISGQVLLPQAYSDDGVAICWMDTSHVTAIMGASDLVQWRLPSLRCTGSEQLSLFSGRSAFNSVTISMRLLRRQQDTQQLRLLYRHCSQTLAAVILSKIKRPQADSRSTSSQHQKMKAEQKAWAKTLAAGLFTLDPDQQQKWRQLVRHHSTCLLGTGAACIMDLREGDMYEKYKTSYFSKLWRSVEACNLIALDFNGDFVLCCSGEGTLERRWLYIVDARGASRQVEESQGWCAARRSYMDAYLVYKRAAPRCLQHACFLSSFFLLTASVSGLAVYDLRLAIFTYYSSRVKAMYLNNLGTSLAAPCAAYSACEGSCSNCTEDEEEGQQQQQAQQRWRSASSTGSRMTRRLEGSGSSADQSKMPSEGHNRLGSSVPSGKAAESPMRCLPALFLRCLQRSAAEHEKRHALLRRRTNASLIGRFVSGASSAAIESCPAASGDAQIAAVSPPGRSGIPLVGSGFQARLNEISHETQGGDEDGRGEAEFNETSKYQQDISAAYEGDCHAFFLFEVTPLAFRVCEAFFRFCSLFVQHQRQQHQSSNICGDDPPSNGFGGPPELCTRKPVRLYRQHARVLYLDTLRTDFCFLSIDSSGWLRVYSLFRSQALQSVRLDRGLFAAGWPYVVASDGPVVAYTCDKGVYALRLNEANMGCSWVTGAEPFCSMPLASDVQEATPAQKAAPA
ncbi:hypothetical protein Efla_001508 [Eimeria flavescens]